MSSVRPKGIAANGDHRWELRVYDERLGRQVSRGFRTGSASERTARKHANRIEAELLAEFSERPAIGSVADIIDEWQRPRAESLSPSTVRNEQRHVDAFRKRFGATMLADLDGRALEAWYADMRKNRKDANGETIKGLTPVGIRERHRIVRTIVRFGIHERGIPCPAIDQVRRRLPPVTARNDTTPSDKVAHLLMSNLKGESGRAITVAAHTGLRRGEVVGLRWADLQDGTIIVRHSVLDKPGGGVIVKEPKGKRLRAVPLDDVVMETLREQHAMVDGRSPWVFPSWSDITGATPARPGWLSTAWARHRKRHGAKSVRLHDLRHWLGSYLIGSGVDAAVVSEILGHAQVSTTMNIYVHPTDDGRQKALRALNGGAAADMTPKALNAAPID